MNKNIKSDLLVIGFLAFRTLDILCVLYILDLILKRNYGNAFCFGFLFIVYCFDLKNKLFNKIKKEFKTQE